MGIIFYLHTPTLGGSMVYSDYVPRIGEALRVNADDDEDGIYKIEDVAYGVPFDKRQRIDVYAIRVGGLPNDLSYSEYMKVKGELNAT